MFFFLERTQYFSKAVTPNSSNALITVNISSSQATLKQADKQSVLKALSCPQPKALSSLSSCVKSGLLIHRIHLKLGSPSTAVLQAAPAAQGNSLPILSLGFQTCWEMWHSSPWPKTLALQRPAWSCILFLLLRGPPSPKPSLCPKDDPVQRTVRKHGN